MRLLPVYSAFLICCFLSSCGSSFHEYKEDEKVSPRNYVAKARAAQKLSKSALIDSVRLHRAILPSRHSARRYSKDMNPRSITIHSTQNWGRTAHAPNHSKALANYKVRGVSWHFTVDQYRAIQHLKLDETAKHTGNSIGNQTSIGIEMCEDTGSNLHATIERTARLTAWLMIKEGISLSRVVPHHYWPRSRSKGHKNCPHFLMDENGQPGAKWYAFKRKVNYYYQNAR